ncbi:ABC transporter ATP-binding protein [Amantichitinum ursilacus]|uniref:Maltose/maltodextrin import ATP-binding protein MalK n=1 Tax=Amantichitinum ursilacus TaxID=857265 RepID=A0A0N1JSK3_9NEIS|nr:sn-glycerol-3-phosphate ABC transporter ATP-binding protein UgpC [Amantichitinum ursilacus]KPC52326.1 Maltose/maltodextrin import ATP-binding protein MalK [Amantichitinum ursilacus]
MATVSLKNIKKRFGDVTTLHGIDLEINDGEFVVFVGPSGCGKTTLLRTISGLEDISEGELQIGGVRMNELPPVKRGIAMVFQSYALYPHMSVFENMAFGLRLAGMSKKDYTPIVQQVAKVLQLDHLLERKPKELSGGQRQRVAIGRAIVQKPEVFLFDEPLSNLDASLRVQMRIEIARLHRELGATMIYVTHDQVEAMTLADRIVVFRAGQLEQVGTPTELYHEPINLFVAGFLGSPGMNFLSGTISSIGADGVQVALTGNQNVTVLVDAAGAKVGDAVTVGVRPEHLHVDLTSNVLTGNAVVLERLGDSSVLYLDNAAAKVPMSVRMPALRHVDIGQRVPLGFKPAHGYLFNADGKAFRRLDPLAE